MQGGQLAEKQCHVACFGGCAQYNVNVSEAVCAALGVCCCSTLDYMAPEVLRCPLKRHPGDNKDRSDLHYATAVDAWAVGVLAYELLTGRQVYRVIRE